MVQKSKFSKMKKHIRNISSSKSRLKPQKRSFWNYYNCFYKSV